MTRIKVCASGRPALTARSFNQTTMAALESPHASVRDFTLMNKDPALFSSPYAVGHYMMRGSDERPRAECTITHYRA